MAADSAGLTKTFKKQKNSSFSCPNFNEKIYLHPQTPI
jgi:hypothetical protein